MDIIQEFIQILNGLSQDPLLFSVVLFIYTVAATVFLPVPVEIALFFSPETPIVVKILVLGTGKAVGAILVFLLGDRLGSGLNGWALRRRFFRRFLDLMHRFVARTRYLGLYIILSTPLMVDTVPVYLFALFNEKGVMQLRWFAVTNFLAGVTRSVIVIAIFYLLGLKLV